MNVRKLVPFSIAAAIVLAACGAASPAAPTSAPATTAPSAATTAPKPADTTVANPPKSADQVDALDLTGKNVEITFWHRYTSQNLTVVQTIVNDFNTKNPYGIKVKLENAGAGYTDVYNKINATIQGGGDLPALSIAYQNQAATYRGQNVMVDLTPFIQSKKYGLTADDLKDIYPYFQQSDKAPQFAGEILGWPTQRSMAVLYSNIDWLKTLGASEAPKTLKDFEALACKASDKAAGTYGWIWRNDASDFASLVFANGGELIKPDGSAYDFNSPAGIETLTMIQRMFKNGCAVELPKTEANGEQNRFAAGKLLFVTGSSSGLPFYASSIAKVEKPFQWQYTMHPQANPDKPIVNLYGASWSVLKTTPEKELAAWLFMKFFTEKDNTAAFATTSNYMAVRASASQLAIDKVKTSKSFAKFPEAAASYANQYSWIQYGAVEAPVVGYDPVRALIQDMVTKVGVKGDGDPKAALDEAVKKSNDILAEFAPKK